MNARFIAPAALATAAAIALALAPLPARAQATTVGELLDSGAKPLGKDEVHALLSGAKIKGMSPQDLPFEAEHKADGSYSGTMTAQDNRSIGIFGKWAVKDDGAACMTIGGGPRRGEQSCGYWLRKGAEHYNAQSIADRGAAARPIAFSK